MRSKIKFELWGWCYFVMYWFIAMGLIIPIAQLVLAPFIAWLFHDLPYSWPTMNKVIRLVFLTIFIAFFAGTVTWYYEKRSSGR